MRVLIPADAPPPGSALFGRPAPPLLARRPVPFFLAASRRVLRRPDGKPVLPQRAADLIGRLRLRLVLCRALHFRRHISWFG